MSGTGITKDIHEAFLRHLMDEGFGDDTVMELRTILESRQAVHEESIIDLIKGVLIADKS